MRPKRYPYTKKLLEGETIKIYAYGSTDPIYTVKKLSKTQTTMLLNKARDANRLLNK
ncbi:hypothetical protein [Streptococcus dysgalactiae]|uniref:hypothetical protein n=1 Tax=Streptococcus dysgalactiae TaxID=1334 RepID=UPI003FD89A19